MNSTPPSSNIDTILPEPTGATTVAEACRSAALDFLNESKRWGQAELATWMMARYAPLAQSATPEDGETPAKPIFLLRDMDPRMVARVVRTAHDEVMSALRKIAEDEASESFAFAMVASGFVVRSSDEAGWMPTTEPRRLADRVLSLLAVDFLTNAADYYSALSMCPRCKHVELDAVARTRGLCSRHGAGSPHSQRFGSLPPPSQPRMA